MRIALKIAIHSENRKRFLHSPNQLQPTISRWLYYFSTTPLTSSCPPGRAARHRARRRSKLPSRSPGRRLSWQRATTRHSSPPSRPARCLRARAGHPALRCRRIGARCPPLRVHGSPAHRWDTGCSGCRQTRGRSVGIRFRERRSAAGNTRCGRAISVVGGAPPRPRARPSLPSRRMACVPSRHVRSCSSRGRRPGRRMQSGTMAFLRDTCRRARAGRQRSGNYLSNPHKITATNLL